MDRRFLRRPKASRDEPCENFRKAGSSLLESGDPSPHSKGSIGIVVVAAVFLAALALAGPARAQDGAADTASAAPRPPETASAERMAEEALAAKEPPAGSQAGPNGAKQIDWLDLILYRAGWLKWPLLAASLLVVAFGLERAMGLRRGKVLPFELIQGLRVLSSQPGGLDPRQAHRVCQQYPSAAAEVVRAVLMKVGRPLAEIERVAEEASNREAARLYANVRWLNLAAAVSPLLGLFGTVVGMIEAFFVTANLPPGANRTDFLAEGIYTALVCTMGGLGVAIPAMVLAHFYEGRIESLFRQLDETLAGFLPQLERLDARPRSSKDSPVTETLASPHPGGAAAAGPAKRSK